MNQPVKYRLSVIVPVYNAEKYLEACVGSILRQNVSDMEIILVDDGSTDSSAEICKRLCTQYAVVRSLHQSNAGAGIARNTGIAEAQGRYIAFVDSDDLLMEGMYSELLAKMENAGADAAMCAFSRFSDNGPLRSREVPLDEVVMRTKQVVYQQWLGPLLGGLPGSRPISSSACRGVYKADIIQQHGIRFISERHCLSEDLVFNVDYFAHCACVVTLSGAYYLYRDNPDSSSRSFDLSRFESLKHLCCLLKNRCEDLSLPQEEYLPRIAYRMIEYTSVFTRQIVTRMPFGEAKKNIFRFAADEMFVSAAADCVPESMDFSLRLFRWLMCRRCYFLLFLLIKLYSVVLPRK